MRHVVLIVSALYSGCLGLSVDHAFAQAQTQPAKVSAEEQLFRTWLKSLQTPEVTVQTGKISLDAGVLTVTDLVLSREVKRPAGVAQVQFRIGTLQLNGLVSDTAATRAAGAVASNLALTASDAPDAGVFLDQLTIGAMSLPDLSALAADPARPVTSHANYLRSLMRGAIGGATATGFRIDKSFTIEKAELGKVSGGQIEFFNLSGVSRSGTGADAQKTTIDKITLSGVNLDTYVRMFEAQSYRTTGSERPWQPLATSLEVSDVRTSAVNGLNAGVAKLSAGPLKLRLFPEDLTAHLDKAATDQGYLAANKDVASLVSSSLIDSVALDGLSMEKLSLHNPGPSGPVDFALGGFSVKGLSARGLDDVSLTGVSVTDSNGSIALGRAGLGQLVLPSPKALADAGAALRDGQTVDRKGLATSVGRVSLDNLDVKTKDVTLGLGSLFLDLKYYVGPTPTNVKASLSKLKLAVSQIKDASLGKVLTDLGYSDLDLSAEFIGAWQEANKEIAVERASIAGVGLGSLSVSGAITGVDATAFQDPGKALAAQLLAGGLRKFRIAYRDESLFGRAFNLIAAQSKQPPDVFKKILSSNMPGIMGGIADPSTRNKFIFAAVAFLNDPKNLEIFSTTNDSVPLSEVQKGLAAPNTLPAILKLDVSANKRN